MAKKNSYYSKYWPIGKTKIHPFVSKDVNLEEMSKDPDYRTRHGDPINVMVSIEHQFAYSFWYMSCYVYDDGDIELYREQLNRVGRLYEYWRDVMGRGVCTDRDTLYGFEFLLGMETENLC